MAAAAREVLVALVPDQAALVEAAYSRALARSRRAGQGRRHCHRAGVRAATLARRQGDGLETATQPVYVPRPGPGEYQFTPPFNFAAQPGWGRVQPFVIDLRGARVDGPQPLSSVQYARDLAYVKAIGDIASTTRTPEQSEIAQFWYEDSPLGWNRITNTVVRQRGLDAWSAARAFALVNFAMADGFIAGFEAKYRFRFWRPETAIREAATDGNPLTEPDPTWQPFLMTPPVPDYPSTHTVLGWAAAEVLIELLWGQGALQRDQPDAAGRDATLQGILGGGRGERPVAPLRRHPFPARREGRTPPGPQHRPGGGRIAPTGSATLWHSLSAMRVRRGLRPGRSSPRRQSRGELRGFE